MGCWKAALADSNNMGSSPSSPTTDALCESGRGTYRAALLVARAGGFGGTDVRIEGYG
jgi:hypothetical protein